MLLWGKDTKALPAFSGNTPINLAGATLHGAFIDCNFGHATLRTVRGFFKNQGMLMAGDIDMGHARALLPLDKAQQITTAHEVVAKKLNVREAEKLVAKVQGAGRQTPLLRVQSEKSRDLVRLEEALSDILTAQVEINVKRKTKRGEQGEITIQFGSLDELNGLIDKLRGGAAE